MTTCDDDLPSDAADDAISIANAEAQAANLKAIFENPLCIFEDRGGNFPDHEEIRLAFAGPGSPQAGECGKWLYKYDWQKLVELAWKEQDRQLQAEGCPEKQIKARLRRGWAWACEGILRVARDKTWATKLRPPSGALEILFRYTGYAWEARDPLRTLAELKLGVRPKLDQKNDAFKTDKAFEVELSHVEKTAAFYGNSPEEKIKGWATDLQMKCKLLREMIRNGVADPFTFAWHGIEIGKAEVMLRTLADSDMLEENVRAAVFGKGQGKGEVRIKIEPTWTRLRVQSGKKPKIREIVAEMGGRITHAFVHGKRHFAVEIPGCEPMPYDAFSETLRRINEDHRCAALNHPEPRKSNRRRG